MSTADEPVFELLRLAAEEVAEGVVVVELEGRWTGDAPPADGTRLVAAGAQVRPVPETASVTDGVLRATFALSAAAAAEPLALAADGLRVRLPEPDGPRADRLAAIARELNVVRRERDGLRAQAQEAETLRSELDALRAELESLRGVAGEAAALRAEHEQLEALRAEAADLRRERDELRLAVKEVAVLRRERDELQLAVKEVEVLRRERDEGREAAAVEADALRHELEGLREEASHRTAELRDARREAARARKELEQERDQAAQAAAAAEDDPTRQLPVRDPDDPDTPAGAVRAGAGPRSERRRAGDPTAVVTNDPGDRPPALYYALAGLGVSGLVVVLLLLL